MVAVVRPSSATDPAVAALILAIESKAILLLDRTGMPTSAIAPALRLGYTATAVTIDDQGDGRGYLSAPMTVDPGQASHALVNLAITQTSSRGPLRTVAMIGDDTTAVMVRDAMRDLRTSGDCDRWIEVLDPTLLRSRLARLLAIIEPVDLVRDEIFNAWDLALAFEPGAIGQIIGELERRLRKLEAPLDAACATVLDYLERHKARADYGALRRQGLEIPVPSARHHEYLPLRMTRARCRPITIT